MKITLPTGSSIGAVVTELDAAQLTTSETQTLKRAVYQHKLLILRNQSFDETAYLALAHRLGTPQVYLQKNYHHPEFREIFVSSNIREDGKKIGVAGTGQYWHTDYQFDAEPLSTTLLYPQILPSTKRETYYIDMEHVFATLPRELRNYVLGARAIHEAKWRYKITPEDIDRAIIDILRDAEHGAPAVTHPAVIVHPVTQKSSLYVSRGFTTGIEGLNEVENAQVMAALCDFTEQPRHVFTHTWCEGDVLYWDNRTLLHRASRPPRDQPSKSYRIGVYDGLPFYSNARPHESSTAPKKEQSPWLTGTLSTPSI